jgi:hypothetical protein
MLLPLCEATYRRCRHHLIPLYRGRRPPTPGETRSRARTVTRTSREGNGVGGIESPTIEGFGRSAGACPDDARVPGALHGLADREATDWAIQATKMVARRRVTAREAALPTGGAWGTIRDGGSMQDEAIDLDRPWHGGT